MATSARFGAWVATNRHITHIRTRRRAPKINGMIERFFAALKYEHLYRRDIAGGPLDRAGHLELIQPYQHTRNISHTGVSLSRQLLLPDSRDPDPRTRTLSSQHLPH